MFPLAFEQLTSRTICADDEVMAISFWGGEGYLWVFFVCTTTLATRTVPSNGQGIECITIQLYDAMGLTIESLLRIEYLNGMKFPRLGRLVDGQNQRLN